MPIVRASIRYRNKSFIECCIGPVIIRKIPLKIWKIKCKYKLKGKNAHNNAIKKEMFQEKLLAKRTFQFIIK